MMLYIGSCNKNLEELSKTWIHQYQALYKHTMQACSLKSTHFYLSNKYFQSR